MTEIPPLDDLSMSFLTAVQEAARGSADGQVSMWQVGESLGLDRGLVQDLAMDLAGLGLLEVKSLSGKVVLTEAGRGAGPVGPSAAAAAGEDPLALLDAIEAGLDGLGLDSTARQDLAIDLAGLRGQMNRSQPLAPVVGGLLKAVRRALEAAPRPADPAWIAGLDQLSQKN